MTGPAMFANGVPQLAVLLAGCAEGRAREIRDQVERHLAQNPEDPRAGFLLRLITAAAPDYGAALKAIEEECTARQAQALFWIVEPKPTYVEAKRPLAAAAAL